MIIQYLFDYPIISMENTNSTVKDLRDLVLPLALEAINTGIKDHNQANSDTVETLESQFKQYYV